MLESPDGAHAWAVAASACLVNGILSGMARMVGVLYVACMEHFGASRGEASLPFTVRNAVRYMAGPATGVLGQAFGVRAVTFWGGLVAAAGSAGCALAPDTRWIVFSWGIVHGLGFALSNTLFQVVINQWFERHRASASGLVLSGACLATLALAPALEGALSGYGLSGCFLLLAGLFLHVLPPAILLRPPPWVLFPEAYARAKERQMKGSSDHLVPKDHRPVLTFRKSLESNPRQQTVVCTLFREFQKREPLEVGIYNPAFDTEESLGTSKSSLNSAVGTAEPSKNNLLRSLKRIPLLYVNPAYVLTSLSMATYFFIFLPVVTVINDYARDKGLPRHHEKLLVYALTFGDMFGRLGLGWITDSKLLSLPMFMLLSFMGQGVFTALLPLSTTLPAWLATVGLYGVMAGGIFVHLPLLVHRYVDQEDQSIGIGSIGLLYSVLGFGIAPLIGHFRDHIGSYDEMFYYLAAASVLNGLLWGLLLVGQKSSCGQSPPKDGNS